MAKRSVIAEPAYVAAATTALATHFPGAGVDHERIRQDRYRFIVVSDRFNRMGHPERQRAVWDLMDQAVIITISAEEAALRIDSEDE
jgi:hypothetical protein